MECGAEREAWPQGRARHGGVDRVPLPAPVPGALWLAGKRYIAGDPDAALAAIGADLAVCLCEEHELAGHWPRYVEWLRRPGPLGLAPPRGPGSGAAAPAALWWPIPDLSAPPPPRARALVETLTARLDAGEGVLVHCGAGMGRAGTIAAAVLMAYGVGPDQARAAVATARPGAGPEAGAQSQLLVELQRN